MTNPITIALDRAADACVQIAEQQSKPWPEARHEPAVLCSTTLPEREYQEQAQLCRQVAMQCADAVRKVRREMKHVNTPHCECEQCEPAQQSAFYDKTDEYDMRDKPTQPQGDVIERQYEELKRNADFLRKSVGACHLMISRDDIGELEADKWENGDLPPRLKKYIDHKIAESNKVLLDEALGPVTDEESEAIAGLDDWLSALEVLLPMRRARLLPESKRTAEERVKIRPHTDLEIFIVLDGKNVACVPVAAAEWCRLGLIAQLKAGQQ